MEAAVRLAGTSDAAAIAAIYRPYLEGSHFTFEEVPPHAGEIAERMANPIHPWLVAADDGRILGYASTSPMRNRAAYRWSVETGIYLVPDARCRGIGRQLLTAQLEILERQGFVTAIAGIALPNDASIALHGKLGFKLAGVERGVGFKLGRWIDVSRWQRDLAPRIGVPSLPRTFADAFEIPSRA